MKNPNNLRLLPVNPGQRRVDPNDQIDVENRIRATKDAAKEIWYLPIINPFMMFFGLLGGWNGVLLGVGIGALLVGMILLTIRYGREL